MTKREELDKILILATGKTGEHLDKVKQDLSELGVVVRVERGHDSDCSTHNDPAYPNGECDCVVLPVGCVAVEPLIEDSSASK